MFGRAVAGFNKNVLGKSPMKSMRSAVKVESGIKSSVQNGVNQVNSAIINPGLTVNNKVADVIKNPAQNITSYAIDSGVGTVLSPYTAGLSNIAVPGSSTIGNKLGGKIQKFLDKGKDAPGIARAAKADKYLKSNLANKIENGVNGFVNATKTVLSGF